MSGIDERLRDLLETAADEPTRPVSVDVVRRQVVRRRLLEGIAGMTTLAVIAVAIPAVAVNSGHCPAVSRTGTAHPRGPVVYVLNAENDTVTPIVAATNKPGRPIRLTDDGLIAVTPDGKTAYVTNTRYGTVTPITTGTNTPGPPITVGAGPDAIAITPDSKTVYVVNYGSGKAAGTVTPITIATNQAGRPVHVGQGASAIAITR
jgi:DNA-binding beta-propeller fold protein YncE